MAVEPIARSLTEVEGAADVAEVLARHQRRAYIVVGIAALLHLAASWGYAGLLWGDHGRWLHEVARYAAGEVPYRDFTWARPPLALWVIGGVARLAGASLPAISATMAVLYAGVIALFLYHLYRLTPNLIMPIALPAAVFAFAYAGRSGVPLPLGTSTPAGPVGFLCLLAGAALMIKAVDRRSASAAGLAGAMAALTMLSRYGFWMPSVYLMLAGTALLVRRGARPGVIAAPWVALVVTLAIGTVLAMAQAGVAPVLDMLIEARSGASFAGFAAPSLERLTVEIAATAALGLTAVTALWLCLAIDDRTAARWVGALALVFLTSTAVYVGMSVAIARMLAAAGPNPLPTISEEALWASLRSGHGIGAASLALFDDRLQANLFPVILPPLLLGALALWWRRWHDRTLANRLALLLGLAVAGRLHAGFRDAQWYNVLLELPCYAMFLQLVSGPATAKAARAVRAALSVLIVLGLYSYVTMARGVLTYHGSFAALATPRGTVHWPPLEAEIFVRVDSLVRAADPTGERPLIAFGGTGGWDYYLRRSSRLPVTGGFGESRWHRDSLLAAVSRLRPLPLLVDNRFAMRAEPSGRRLLRWEPEPEPNVFGRLDRAPFLAVRERCGAVPGQDTTQMVVVYDCAHPPVADTAKTAAARPARPRAGAHATVTGPTRPGSSP